MMGRDEHTKRKNSRLAQTPKNQLMDGMMNVDYLEEFSDETGMQEQRINNTAMDTTSADYLGEFSNEVNPEAQEINEAAHEQQRKK